MDVHRNGMKRFVFAAPPAIGSGEANAKSIRSDLETILYDDFDIDGYFSFNKAYPDAPNPGLGLADLGLVGLPLGAREEELVKARCQPLISDDNTTCVPRYMAARKVAFSNAMWPRFLARITRDVCDGLGALYPKGHPPTLELRKLLLCEPGLQILLPTERRSQSEQKRVFAHVIIFLPSNFTGGSACFKLPRSGFSITQQCGVNNPYETNVLAWHADVNYDIQPITTGTRLALCFDLIHNAPSPRPELSVDEELIFRLRSVFAAWRRDEGRSSPSKLIYLLGETKYVSSRKGLDGSDVLKVDILSMIAEEEGIHLGLANVEYRQAGPGAREDGDYYFTDRREVETSLSVTDFVNLDGKAISPTLKVGYNETIPSELRDAIIDDEECDDEEFESDYDERHSSLVRTWDRSVLVMWPVWSNL